MIRYLAKLFFPILLLGVSGCIVPMPSKSTIAHGLRGKIIDNETGAPIYAAHIDIHLTSNILQQCISSDDGTFNTDPFVQKHWGHYYGLALNHKLPPPKRFFGEPLQVRIMHPEYESKELWVLTPDWPSPTMEQSCSQHRAISETNQYLKLGVIKLIHRKKSGCQIAK